MMQKERGEEEEQQRLGTREGGLGFPIHPLQPHVSSRSRNTPGLHPGPSCWPTHSLHCTISSVGKLFCALHPPCYHVDISSFFSAPFVCPGTTARSEVWGVRPQLGLYLESLKETPYNPTRPVLIWFSFCSDGS